MWKSSVSENLEEKLESFNSTSSSTQEKSYTTSLEYDEKNFDFEFSAVELFPNLKIHRYTPAYAMNGAFGYTWRDETVYTGILYDEHFFNEVVFHEAVHNYYSKGHDEYETRLETAKRIDYLGMENQFHIVYRR